MKFHALRKLHALKKLEACKTNHQHSSPTNWNQGPAPRMRQLLRPSASNIWSWVRQPQSVMCAYSIRQAVLTGKPLLTVYTVC
jgi:hypothetical protein